MKKLYGITVGLAGLLLSAPPAFAFQRMGGSACPVAAGGWVACALSGLICIGVIVLFFWLLFRIARALEKIADSKTRKE